MMVAANLAKPQPAFFCGHTHFWFRLYGSFAAPLFVLLSGMIVAYTARRKGHGLGHFRARGAMMILVAALLEVLIWKFYPFLSVDVLYLIGVSLPLVVPGLAVEPCGPMGNHRRHFSVHSGPAADPGIRRLPHGSVALSRDPNLLIDR